MSAVMSVTAGHARNGRTHSRFRPELARTTQPDGWVVSRAARIIKSVTCIEGQYSWADLNGDHANPFDVVDILTTKVSSVATVAGRLGYAVDRVLFYAKGGGAWIRDKYTIVDLGLVEATASATRSGWLAGGGIEYAFWNNFSAKLEYNYMDFGTHRLSFTDLEGGPAFPLDIRQNLQTVTLGVNYRFGLFR